MFLVGFGAGFIELDGMTYLLMLLVLSVGLNITAANAAKALIACAVCCGPGWSRGSVMIAAAQNHGGPPEPAAQ